MNAARKAVRSCAQVGACLLALAAPSRAADHPSWRVVQGEVRILCPMTVGGGFEARTSALLGTLALAGARPVALGGDLVVDLRTLDTGIGLRNTHLRDAYLEVGKGDGFEKAVLSNLKLGDVDPETFQGRTAFTGDLALHGAKVQVTGEAEIRREGKSFRVNATFPVRISDYGIAKPQYLGVGVRDVVQVKVTLDLSDASVAEGAAR